MQNPKIFRLACSILLILALTSAFLPSIITKSSSTVKLDENGRSSKDSSMEMQLNVKTSKLEGLPQVSFHLKNIHQQIQQDLKTSLVIQSPEPEDLEETEDVQITEEIRLFAVDELKSDPLKIFLYVYNEIGFIPYGWSLQGSAMTLSTGYGNDYDQSSLLIALYRAAGIPARYVQGYVKVTPEQMANWVGAKDDIMPYWICMLSNMNTMPQEGIYYVLHCWVKAYIDEKWIELDPSFKEYRYYEKMDFSDVLDPLLSDYPELNNPEEIRSDKLSQISDQVKNAVYSKIISLPEDTKIKSVIGGQVILKVDDYISPPEPMHPQANIESSSLGIKDRYLITFMFPKSDTTQPFGFSRETYHIYNTSTVAIAGKRITLSFPPTSEKDYATIKSYGSLLKTPCNEFTVKPVLLVDGKPVLVGDPMKPGEVFPYTIISYYPYYSANRGDVDWNVYLEKHTISGSYIAVSVNLAKVPLDYGERIQHLQDNLNQKTHLLDDLLGELLYGRAMAFWFELEKYTSIIAQEFGDVIVFEAPGIVLSGYEMKKDIVNNKEYLRFNKSTIDIHLATGFLPRTTDHPENVIREGGGEYAQEDPKAVAAQFLFGLFGAQLEGYLFYYLYNTPPTSALHLVVLADNLGIPIHVINSNNFSEEMGFLEYDGPTLSTLRQLLKEIVDEGKTVLIPERSIKNQILTITITTQNIDYTPQRYSMFDGIGYLTIDDKGRFGSHTLLTYRGGFSGISEDYDEFGDEKFWDEVDSINAEQDLVLDINDPDNTLDLKDKVDISQDMVDITWDKEKLIIDDISTETVDVTIPEIDISIEEEAPQDTEVRGGFLSGLLLIGNIYKAIKIVVTHGTDYGRYLQFNRDDSIPKKILKAGGVFAGEMVIKTVGLVHGGVKGLVNGLKGLAGHFDPKVPSMGPSEAKRRFWKSFTNTLTEYDESYTSFRRDMLDLDPNTGQTLQERRDRLAEEFGGKPEDYLQIELSEKIQLNSLFLGGIPPILNERSLTVDSKKWYTWMISHTGLTVGSNFNGKLVTDMPHIIFEDEIDGTIANYYIWNPRPNEPGETYKLVISNQDDIVNDFHVYIELSGGGESKYDEVKLSLQEGEETFIPIRLISNPLTGDMEIEVEEPQPSYTVSFIVDAPTPFYEFEVYLDDKYLTSMEVDTYKILAFDEGSEHSIRLKPEKLQYGEDVLIVQPSQWQFSERNINIFQYGSGAFTSTLTSPFTTYTSDIYRSVDPYVQYIGPIVLIFIISVAVLLHRRKPSVETRVPGEALKYCISCRERIREDAIYCTKCGEPQDFQK